MKSTLKKHVDNKSSLSNVAKNMIKEVNQRFSHLLDPDHPDCDPVYAVATFYRRYKTLLRKELLTSTKKAIVAIVCETFEGVSDDTDSDLSPTKEPPNKHPCVDPLYG